MSLPLDRRDTLKAIIKVASRRWVDGMAECASTRGSNCDTHSLAKVRAQVKEERVADEGREWKWCKNEKAPTVRARTLIRQCFALVVGEKDSSIRRCCRKLQKTDLTCGCRRRAGYITLLVRASSLTAVGALSASDRARVAG